MIALTQAASAASGGQLSIATGIYAIDQPNCAKAASTYTIIHWYGRRFLSRFGECRPQVKGRTGNIWYFDNRYTDGRARVLRPSVLTVISPSRYILRAGGVTVSYYWCAR